MSFRTTFLLIPLSVLSLCCCTSPGTAQGTPKLTPIPKPDQKPRKKKGSSLLVPVPPSEVVNKGLQWLEKYQQKDGSWKLEGPYKNGGRKNDTAATAMALLPFLRAGITHKAKPPTNKVVLKGLTYLIRTQNPRTGDLGGGSYAHFLGTMVLCRAYGMTQDPRLRRPAKMAVNYIIAAQHICGCWRYRPKQSCDLSNTGWVAQALELAAVSKLEVPKTTVVRLVQFLDSCEAKGGGYSYLPARPASPSMTAAGLLCRHTVQGWGPKNPKFTKAMKKYILGLKTIGRPRAYTNYYATKVVQALHGEKQQIWNKAMKKHLLDRQEADGSWNPRGQRYAGSGGRLMITSFSLMMLQEIDRQKTAKKAE